MADNPYRMVSCDFRDLLEEAATLQKPVRLRFFEGAANDLEKEITAMIKDIYTKGSAEFLILEDGKIIRLDRIISINGKTDTVC